MISLLPKTKIVCTIGPASDKPEIINQLIQEGLSVARLNFSHGTREEHAEKISIIRELSEELNMPVAIMQDLSGPKIRVGKIPEPGLVLEEGKPFILTAQKGVAEAEPARVSVSYENLPKELKVGDIILLADGFMELAVTKIEGLDIHCTVTRGGILTSHKGINIPTESIGVPSITEKDKEDLAFGLEHGVDYVALSFVRKAEDVIHLKDLIAQKGKDTPVIAKIEKWEAVNNIEEIMEVTDAIMVARGDLGVEIPLERVPMVQKMLIRKANMAGKPVITATQMLRSMVDQPRPTRAEATDVANAVLDGTDAVMLSEETASGKYPVEAVQNMVKIIKQAEETFPYGKYLEMMPHDSISESVAHVACVLARNLNASAIVATTRSGQTARFISRFRPSQGIIALSPQPETVRHLCLEWGCFPRVVEEPKDTDDMFEKASRHAIETGLVSKGDLVVITAGHPVWVKGTTNMLRVHTL